MLLTIVFETTKMTILLSEEITYVYFLMEKDNLMTVFCYILLLLKYYTLASLERI
jgi:hypothetical protein